MFLFLIILFFPIIWFILFILTAIFLTPPKKQKILSYIPDSKIFKSNCFFWALSQWWEYGGYLCFRPSKVWRGPHILWLPKEEEKMQHFIPVKNADAKIGYKIHWLMYFSGKVKIGDKV